MRAISGTHIEFPARRKMCRLGMPARESGLPDSVTTIGKGAFSGCVRTDPQETVHDVDTVRKAIDVGTAWLATARPGPPPVTGLCNETRHNTSNGGAWANTAITQKTFAAVFNNSRARAPSSAARPQRRPYGPIRRRKL